MNLYLAQNQNNYLLIICSQNQPGWCPGYVLANSCILTTANNTQYFKTNFRSYYII